MNSIQSSLCKSYCVIVVRVIVVVMVVNVKKAIVHQKGHIVNTLFPAAGCLQAPQCKYCCSPATTFSTSTTTTTFTTSLLSHVNFPSLKQLVEKPLINFHVKNHRIGCSLVRKKHAYRCYNCNRNPRS